MTDNINKIRKLIDKIDLDILRLLTTRGMLAQEMVEAAWIKTIRVFEFGEVENAINQKPTMLTLTLNPKP